MLLARCQIVEARYLFLLAHPNLLLGLLQCLSASCTCLLVSLVLIKTFLLLLYNGEYYFKHHTYGDLGVLAH